MLDLNEKVDSKYSAIKAASKEVVEAVVPDELKDLRGIKGKIKPTDIARLIKKKIKMMREGNPEAKIGLTKRTIKVAVEQVLREESAMKATYKKYTELMEELGNTPMGFEAFKSNPLFQSEDKKTYKADTYSAFLDLLNKQIRPGTRVQFGTGRRTIKLIKPSCAVIFTDSQKRVALPQMCKLID